jgi:hypothetical protein
MVEKRNCNAMGMQMLNVGCGVQVMKNLPLEVWVLVESQQFATAVVLVFAVLMVVKPTRARRSVKAEMMPRRCTGSIAASIFCRRTFSVDTRSSALASECNRARRRIVVLIV